MACYLHFRRRSFNLILWLFLWLPTKTTCLAWVKCCPIENQILTSAGRCTTGQGNTSVTQKLLQNSPCGVYNGFQETECESSGESNELMYGVSHFTFSKRLGYVHLNATDSLVHCHDLQVCSDEVESTNQEGAPILMARYCKSQKRKPVRKCCLPGYVMNARFACVPSNNSIAEKDIEIFDWDERDERLSQSFQKEVQFFFTGFNRLPRSVCPHQAYAAGPQIEPGHEQLYLLTTGQLYVQTQCRKEILDDFCLERQDDNGSLQLIALRCFPPPETLSTDQKTANGILASLQFVAAIFLLLTFLTYAVLAELRNLHGLVVMSHVFSLAITFIGLGVIRLIVLPDPFCFILALMTHYFFLSTFTWMSVMSFDIWWKVTSGTPRQAKILQKSERKRNLCIKVLPYSIYAWGVPLLIVSVGFILDTVEVTWCAIKPGFAVKSCWFIHLEYEPFSKKPELYYLYGPISVTLLSNIVFFSLTASFLSKSRSPILASANQKLIRERRMVVFNVFMLMGITWIMEIVSWVVGGSQYYWLPTDSLGILRGILIFVIFVCKRNVLSILRKRWELLQISCSTFCLTRLGCNWVHKFRAPPESISSSNPTVSTTLSSTMINSSPELKCKP